MSRHLERSVSAYIKKMHMIESGDTVIVGLSGGADSVCLFRVLLALRQELGFAIEAVHVNHCLRDSAARDEAFVRELCRKEDVVLHSYSVDVQSIASREGMTLEEAGRHARYECFSNAMQKSGAGKVAVAHHKNDQAETLLFHLGRGAGIDGMTGMRPVREHVIRPLLCANRGQIEEYLADLGQSYVTDETNDSTEYSRNRLRHEVIPVLEEICPRATEHIAAVGETMAELSDYLQEQIQTAVRDCVDLTERESGIIRLSCDEFFKLHEYLQGETIRECMCLLAGSKKDISRTHVESVKRLAELQVGRKTDLPYDMEVEKSYGIMIFSKKGCMETVERSIPDFCVELSVQALENGVRVQLPDGKTMSLRTFAYDPVTEIPTKAYTKWLDYDKMNKPIVIRTVRENDFFYFDYKNKKYVKDYMVNEKIPRAERRSSIVVADGNHMLYFVGKRISNGVLVDRTTKKILEITVTGG